MIYSVRGWRELDGVVVGICKIGGMERDNRNKG